MMARKRLTITDERIDRIIGNMLRAGVIISSLIVLIGGAIYVAKYGAALPNYRIFHGEPSTLRHISEIVGFAASFHGRGLIQVGLLLLIATPVLRVAFTVVCFAIQRDRIYVGVTLIVLALLVYSLTGGVGGGK